MRSNPDGTFDLDVSWQSLDEWGDKKYQNLTSDQIARITRAIELIATETDLERLNHTCLDKHNGNVIRAIKEYRTVMRERTGSTPSLLEAKNAIYEAAGRV